MPRQGQSRSPPFPAGKCIAPNQRGQPLHEACHRSPPQTPRKPTSDTPEGQLRQVRAGQKAWSICSVSPPKNGVPTKRTMRTPNADMVRGRDHQPDSPELECVHVAPTYGRRSPGGIAVGGCPTASRSAQQPPNGLELSCPAARATAPPILAHSGGQVTLQLSARQPGQLQRVVGQHPDIR